MQHTQLVWIVKGVVTFASLVYGVLPAIADLNETHLYNSGWSPHARVHGAWFLFFGAFMAFLSVFLLWMRNEIILPILIGLCYVAGFWLAFITSPFYGGALVDTNGVETRILGLESNVFVFSVLAILLGGCLFYMLRRPEEHADEP
ncbi:MAG: DUF6640 family protein [Pseudomonadota bacterium]